MLFRQYLDNEPVIAVSYLLGCPTEGIGAVVDPVGDVGRYLKESEEGGVPLRYVIDTHMHADHISRKLENPMRLAAIKVAGEPMPRYNNFRPWRTVLMAGFFRNLQGFIGAYRRLRAGDNREPLA